MKRKLLTLVMVMASIAAMTACGKTNDEVQDQLTSMAPAESVNSLDQEIEGDGPIGDVPSNDFEVRIGKTSFSSYDEIINLLEGEEGYAFVNVKGYDGQVLLLATYNYDDLLGHFATTECTAYTMKANGTVTADTALFTGGSVTPVAIDADGVIYTATHMSVDKYCYGDNGTEDAGLMCLATVSTEEYDDNGDPKKVAGFVRKNNSLINDDIQDIAEDDVATYKQLFDDYYAAEVINFTRANGDEASEVSSVMSLNWRTIM